MYTVVGCPDCRAVKIVEDRPETTECPRCGRRWSFDRLRRFHSDESLAAAREARGRLLAARSDADVDPADVTVSEVAAEAAGVDDTVYLDRQGVDADAVADAGARATSGVGTAGGSRRETLKAILRDLETPTRDAVLERAEAAGLSRDWTETALQKLRERGVVTVTDGHYRLL